MNIREFSATDIIAMALQSMYRVTNRVSDCYHIDDDGVSTMTYTANGELHCEHCGRNFKCPSDLMTACERVARDINAMMDKLTDVCINSRLVTKYYIAGADFPAIIGDVFTTYKEVLDAISRMKHDNIVGHTLSSCLMG